MINSIGIYLLNIAKLAVKFIFAFVQIPIITFGFCIFLIDYFRMAYIFSKKWKNSLMFNHLNIFFYLKNVGQMLHWLLIKQLKFESSPINWRFSKIKKWIQISSPFLSKNLWKYFFYINFLNFNFFYVELDSLVPKSRSCFLGDL